MMAPGVYARTPFGTGVHMPGSVETVPARFGRAKKELERYKPPHLARLSISSTSANEFASESAQETTTPSPPAYTVPAVPEHRALARQRTAAVQFDPETGLVQQYGNAIVMSGGVRIASLSNRNSKEDVTTKKAAEENVFDFPPVAQQEDECDKEEHNGWIGVDSRNVKDASQKTGKYVPPFSQAVAYQPPAAPLKTNIIISPPPLPASAARSTFLTPTSTSAATRWGPDIPDDGSFVYPEMCGEWRAHGKCRKGVQCTLCHECEPFEKIEDIRARQRRGIRPYYPYRTDCVDGGPNAGIKDADGNGMPLSGFYEIVGKRRPVHVQPIDVGAAAGAMAYNVGPTTASWIPLPPSAVAPVAYMYSPTMQPTYIATAPAPPPPSYPFDYLTAPAPSAFIIDHAASHEYDFAAAAAPRSPSPTSTSPTVIPSQKPSPSHTFAHAHTVGQIHAHHANTREALKEQNGEQKMNKISNVVCLNDDDEVEEMAAAFNVNARKRRYSLPSQIREVRYCSMPKVVWLTDEDLFLFIESFSAAVSTRSLMSRLAVPYQTLASSSSSFPPLLYWSFSPKAI